MPRWFDHFAVPTIIPRVWTTVSYNVQALPPSRPLSYVLNQLNSDIIALQGTGSRWNFAQRQQGQQCFTQNVGAYHVYIWPFNVHSPYVNKSCGMILALRRSIFPGKSVCRIYEVDEDLEGRAAAMRLRLRSGIDFTLLNVYCPPPSSPMTFWIACRLWNWASSITQSLPQRSIPMLFTDANSRLGKTSLRTPDGYLLVGPYLRQQENLMGTALRRFLQTNTLAAINTCFRSSGGPTWYNSQGHSSCIDYIISVPEFLPRTVSARVDRYLGHRLQLPNIAILADHCPLFWSFRYGGVCEQLHGQRGWPRQIIEGMSYDEFLRDLDEWAGSEATRIDSTKFQTMGEVDEFWHFINDKVADELRDRQPLQAFRRYPFEDPEAVRLLAQRGNLRDQLFEWGQHDAISPLGHFTNISSNLFTRNCNEYVMYLGIYGSIGLQLK